MRQRSDTAAIVGNSSGDGSDRGDRPRQRHDKIRVIIVLFRPAVAEVNHFISGCTQLPGQKFLQLVTAMVGGDADAFRRFERALANVF